MRESRAVGMYYEQCMDIYMLECVVRGSRAAMDNCCTDQACIEHIISRKTQA